MKNTKLLVIGHGWPEPEATAAGLRMLQLLAGFKEWGWQLTFVSTAAIIPDASSFGELDITTGSIELNDSSFDHFLEKLQPNLVLFDRFHTEEQFGWRVDKILPNTLKILDTEDLHSLREARALSLEEPKGSWLQKWLELDITKREIASIYRCDLSLIISEFEISLLQEHLQIPSRILHYMPFMARTKCLPEVPFEERKDYLFIGNGKHSPNVDAIRYLKLSIWPLIRELQASAEINIYGAYLPQSILDLNDPKIGFNIRGKAPIAQEVMKMARINLAPLRFGAGLKGKVFIAMETATPSVVSSIAKEGLMDDDLWLDYIQDEPQNFAKAAVWLYQDKEEWEAYNKNGGDLLEERFNGGKIMADLKIKVVKIQADLRAHRKKNFTGSLLKHHTLGSTMYLARWIETKQKLQSLDAGLKPD